MPTPLGHALVGLTIHAATARGRALADPVRIVAAAAAATAPDLDLLWRFVDGRNHHQQETHSLAAALLAGLVVLAFSLARKRQDAAALAGLVALGWASHVLCDFLGHDTSPPIGLMALWPLTREPFHCPWSLFLDVGRTFDLATVRHNLVSVAWEMVVLLPPFLWAWGRALDVPRPRLEL